MSEVQLGGATRGNGRRRRGRWGSWIGIAVVAMAVMWAAGPTASLAAPGGKAEPDPRGRATVEDSPRRIDNAPHPLGKRQYALRQKAVEAKVRGHASGRVHEVAKGQFVELEQTRHDRIFVILAEFGDESLRAYRGSRGPLHNEIVEPDRTVDNATVWAPDFNRAYYEDLYFNEMLGFYREQSSGRYAFDGKVTDWVKVRYNEARYGSNLCDCEYELVRDGVNAWMAAQLASGRTLDDIRAELREFDVWDRYDHDADGNFDEPDGYIDHFQIVHAGEGEETGGGAQGEDAIWSHRSYAYYQDIGYTGPTNNPSGGTEFGGTGLWVGDYTMQPENGGLGVFAHEFAHDLGLPDHYDWIGPYDNSVAFWNLMSLGSYLSDGTGQQGLGSAPAHMSAWDKLQLGWLDYAVAPAGATSTHELGPAEFTSRSRAQALIATLPDKEKHEQLVAPYAGSYAWWSGKGDDIDNSMTRTISVPAADPKLSMAMWWDIERDWDYAYVMVSGNGGATWTNLASRYTTDTDPYQQNFGNGITGTSRRWIPTTWDLAPWAGQTIQLRIRYWTDGYIQGKGVLVDSIRLGSFTDGAESGSNGWTLDGFTPTGAVGVTKHFHAYVAELRQYLGYDRGLQTGPYNFSDVDRWNWVEHFPYQDGLLISYWDSSMSDNNVTQHPGEGLILPVDAHPEPLIRGDGQPWPSRIQGGDSTFGLEPTDPFSLTFANFFTMDEYATTHHPSLPANPTFDDRVSYWRAASPYSSVKVPATATIISVAGYSPRSNSMTVTVRSAA